MGKETKGVTNYYPIGSIYVSVNNINPSSIFGGTWVSVGAGKTLVGVDTNDSDYNTVEKTGGSKTKTLITENLPAHNHSASSSTTTTGTFANHTHSGTSDNTTPTGYTFSGTNQTGGFTAASYNSITTSGPFSKGTSSYYGTISSSTKDCGPVWFNFSYTPAGTVTGGKHTHTFTTGGSSGDISATSTTTTTIDNTGSGTAFDVKNPYFTVYFWKRTA